jgi:DNA-directed RNA polymerase sigma subunit (sigma70/sigma32)
LQRVDVHGDRWQFAVNRRRSRPRSRGRHAEHDTGPEIAELTGLSLANVQQILSRSLRRLRAELERAAAPDALERSVVA